MFIRKEKSHFPKAALVVTILVLVVAGGVYGVRALWHTSLSSAPAGDASQAIEQARQLCEEGRLDEARALIEPVASKLKDETLAPQALMVWAEVEYKAGQLEKALECLKRAAYDFPQGAERPSALTQYAHRLEEANRLDEALAIYTELRDSAPPQLRAPGLTGLGRQALRDGKKVEARDLFAQAVHEAQFDSEAWNEALDALGAVNVELIFAAEPTPESKVYSVEKGDNLIGIGTKLNTPVGMMERANGVTQDTTLQVGQPIKYTPKDFRILIERSKCRLFLLDKDGIFKRYFTGLGMPGHETALGSFKIGNKQKDPIWHKPGEGPIPAGDPRNELGTRWMPLVPVEEGLPKDLGIHGTIKPETVGGFFSHGCARLLNNEVEELYDLVVRSTPVQIVETVTPEMLG